ncbi:MAG: nucleotidyl transferase AbiEii/AbiGii toxin family protein [Pseudomonadota bacterium]
MKPAFGELLSLAPQDRRAIYAQTTTHWPTTSLFVEKDLWVCAALDALFNDIAPDTKDLVFKGGTSLSKVYGLTKRFSEDIDLVIVREQLGFTGDDDPMNPEADLSRKARERLVEALVEAAADHIQAALLPRLTDIFEPYGAKVVIDPDPGQRGQTLLIQYESAVDKGSDYVVPEVRLECGARSATLPAHLGSLAPYLTDAVPDYDFTVERVQTIDAERTFLDKLLILHSRQCHYRDRGVVYRDANRESRHYYDVAMMADDPLAERALGNSELRADVIRHSRLAFPSGWAKFDEAEAGNFQIVPDDELRDALRADYTRMADMVLGDAPEFDWVMEKIVEISGRFETRES